LTGKISTSVGVIYKLRHCLPLKALQNLYYSMVQTHLLYGTALLQYGIIIPTINTWKN